MPPLINYLRRPSCDVLTEPTDSDGQLMTDAPQDSVSGSVSAAPSDSVPDASPQTAVAGVRERHPDLVVHGVRYPTPPVQSLLSASETAQLLVIGARGWEGFTGLLVGSTALNVVPYAKCPVVVVHPTPAAVADSGAAAADGPHAGQVVLGYDGSVSANAAAAVAIRQ